MAIHWSVPVWLWPLLLILAAGAVVWTVWVYRRTRPHPPAAWRRRLAALRAAALVLLVLAAAGPVLNRLGLSREPAELVVVVDDSASMALADAGPDGQRPRWDTAVALADTLAARLAARHPEARASLLRGSGLDAPAPLDPARPPTRVGSDLDGLVGGALRQGAGRPVRAVVVVSDGGETRHRLGAARGAAADGPRLLVAGVGDAGGAADRLITDLRHPAVAHVGDEVVFEFRVDQRGPATPVDSLGVRLVGPTGAVADTTVAAAPSVPLRLTWRPRTPGLALLELAADTLVNERYPDNNRVSLVVDVRPDRRRVLLVAARPDWNARFLAQAALDEPRLELVTVHGTADGMVRADSLTAWSPPRDVAGWQAWDGVVLAGWPPDLDAAPLAAAVDAGLGLCVLPVAAGPVLDPAPVGLADLLPVTIARWQWRTGTWYATAGGATGHPLLAGVGRGVRRLPPVERALPSVPRPGAEVALALGAARAAADSATMPLLVTASRGVGRLLWCAAPDLWQLAFGEAVAAGAAAPADAEAGVSGGAGVRLLRNLLVWTASGEEEAGLAFQGVERSQSAGEPVRLEARWRDMRGRAVSGRDVRIAVRRADADSAGFTPRTAIMAPVPGAPGAYAAALEPLPPGTYVARLTGEGTPPVVGGTTRFVVTSHTVEATQVRRDQDRLEALARRWRGAAWVASTGSPPVGLVAALDELDWSPRGQPRRRRWDPWSTWPFLLLASGLLGLEWFLRRRLGLL